MAEATNKTKSTLVGKGGILEFEAAGDGKVEVGIHDQASGEAPQFTGVGGLGIDQIIGALNEVDHDDHRTIRLNQREIQLLISVVYNHTPPDHPDYSPIYERLIALRDS